MKEFIKSTLIELYSQVTTDQYGQVSISNLTPNVFGDEKEKVEKYCKDNEGILQFSTYGGQCGIYRAFRVIDEEIKKACNIALSHNPNYLRNVNSW